MSVDRQITEVAHTAPCRKLVQALEKLSPSCVALGRNLGAAFLASPPPVPSSRSTPFGERAGAGRGWGRASKKVEPKFLPRATQDVESSDRAGVV